MRRVRTFRVFVSSPFADMKAERNALQERVFPRLERFCARNDARFQAVDLRWGVSDEAAHDQRTMPICLDEIERCRATSPRPNFVVLLGDRYGWCPLPTEVATDELTRIRGGLAESARAMLDAWYERDDNAVPAVHYLKPRSVSDSQSPEARRAEAERWRSVERTLGPPLGASASATEIEIRAGALRVPDAREHVHCFFRTIEDVPVEVSAADFVDLVEDASSTSTGAATLDSIARARLDALKVELVEKLGSPLDEEAAARIARILDDEGASRDQLRERLLALVPSRSADLRDEVVRLLGSDAADDEVRLALRGLLVGNVHRYTSRWTGDGISTAHLEALCADVYEALARVIRVELSRVGVVDALQDEIDAHDRSVRAETRLFTGRERLVEEVLAYVAGAAQEPLVLHGHAGCGKTALLARAVEMARARLPGCAVVTRFIGTTPASSTGRGMIESLCAELTRALDGDGSIPTEFEPLARELPRRMALARPDRALLVVLDALDQLPEHDPARTLTWMPRTLPPNVKLVVSTTTDALLPAFERRLPPTSFLELPPLTPSDGGALLDRWLADAGRTLQREQRREVLDRFACHGSPLYLRLAFEQARRWRSTTEAHLRSPEVEDIVEDTLAGLAGHGSLLVYRSLAALVASRRGLAEDELLATLSRDRDVLREFRSASPESPPTSKLPVVVWLRLFADLRPYLDEREADDALLLTFSSRRLTQIVERAARAELAGAHAALAAHFGRAVRSTRRRTVHALVEAPYQLIASGDRRGAEELLSDLAYLDDRSERCDVHELLDDYAALGDELPVEVAAYERFLRRHVQRLARYPGLLFTLVHREGFPAAREEAGQLLSAGRWRKRWIRIEDAWMPPRDLDELAEARVVAEIPIPASCAADLAVGARLVFFVRRVGEIGVVDADRCRVLSHVIFTREKRPLAIACAADGRHLAIAFEDGEAVLLALDYAADGLCGERDILSFRYRVPALETPVLEFVDESLWYQAPTGAIISLDRDDGAAAPPSAPLAELAGAELSGVCATGAGTVVAARRGDDTFLVVVDSGTTHVARLDGCDVTALAPVGPRTVAIATTDYVVRLLDTVELRATAEARVSELPVCCGGYAGAVVWISEDGALHRWRPGCEEEDVAWTGPSLLGARRLTVDADGTCLVGGALGAVSFALGRRATANVGPLDAVFAVDARCGHYTLHHVADELWLVDGISRRHDPIASHASGEYAAALDGTNRVLGASAIGKAFVADLDVGDVRLVGDIPPAVMSVVGRPRGGFWLARADGTILAVDGAPATCTVAGNVSLPFVTHPRIKGSDGLLIWIGTCLTDVGDGTENVDVAVFFQPQQSSNVLREIGRRVFDPTDGLLCAWAYDAVGDVLWLFWQNGARHAQSVMVGSVDEFLHRREQESALAIDPNPIAATLARDRRSLAVLCSTGTLFWLDATTLRVLATLAGAEPVTLVGDGLDADGRVPVVFGGSRVGFAALEGAARP